MIKRLGSFLLSVPAKAYDEEQAYVYILNLLFGDDALWHKNDAGVKKLIDALYLCNQQSNNDGQNV